MKFGARILKTGIAIVLALYLSELLNLPAPVLSGIAAIFAIQPTIYRSYQTVLEQVQGNIIGAIVAITFVLVFGNDYFIVGLAVMVVITINLKLKMDKTIVLSIVTVIAIMESQEGQFLTFAFIRLSSVLLGIVSSFVVNLVFLPPKYEAKLYTRITDVTEEILKWTRISTRHATEHMLLKKDISRLKDDLVDLEHLFSMYKEEREYFKRNNVVKVRKLVVYRQMIITSKKAFETLKRIHKFENEFYQMPENFQRNILSHVDSLIRKHEQLILLHIEKIKSIDEIEGWDKNCLSRKEILSFFFEQKTEVEKTHKDLSHLSARLVPLISAIIEYDEQLEHLETLIVSFQSFHKDDNEISIQYEED